ncbi:hypothetical protein CBM2634_B140111 [Cupriavidus taiwanensis]|uniref:Uncharacterized protein n=1 Tax=Cupriavidus taiwanensis TaxID=164546 RepID=A0A375J5J2_9BURK|nr:hypothetical protein CBM2634_B140111 [Cupriavidus taiwanensis]
MRSMPVSGICHGHPGPLFRTRVTSPAPQLGPVHMSGKRFVPDGSLTEFVAPPRGLGLLLRISYITRPP